MGEPGEIKLTKRTPEAKAAYLRGYEAGKRQGVNDALKVFVEECSETLSAIRELIGDDEEAKDAQ